MKLTNIRFPIIILSLFALYGYSITQVAAGENSQAQQSIQSATLVLNSKLLVQTQGDYKAYIPVVAKPCPSNCYYVDSLNGSDFNSGKSISDPWQTLAPVNSTHFLPGDIIHFKRGSSWNGGLIIDDSGIGGNPILFTVYGSGDRPVIRNPGKLESYSRSVSINANWIIVEGLYVSDAVESGIDISPSANHTVVQDNEITNTGFGVTIHGMYNLVTRNYIHDLRMVQNTPGGYDDYGAVGVLLNHASNNEISYNSMVNCSASSYDFGTDGGAVEWWGDSNNNYIHHNWATGDDGFFEVGGGTAWDNLIAYNISVNNGDFSTVHLEGPFASDVRNFRIENNTIVETANPGSEIFGFDGSPSINTFLLTNNLLYVDRFVYISNKPSFTHHNNLYYLSGGTELGYTLSQEEIIADPLFVDRDGEDFHQMPTSPAIDAGLDLGYKLDFDSNPLPSGLTTDIGAYEYQSPP
jgi:hypothetical protein